MISKPIIHKKIRFYSAWDLKSVFGITIFVLIGGFLLYLVYKPSGDNLEMDKDYYNSKTTGIVYDIEMKEGFYEGRTGNRSTTLGYEIRYSYKVNGKIYNKVEDIKFLNVAMNKFISFAYENLNNEVFTVRYVSSNPDECILVKTINNEKK